MNKRILIAGAGANQIGIFDTARALGLFAVAADGDPHAPGLPRADAAEVIDIRNGDALVQAARRHRADAVYPAAELAVEAVAQAAAELGLPGVPPEVAHRVRNKLAMRIALEAAGIPNPRFAGARTLDEALAAAERIGLPLIVKPADANASKGVRYISRIEDLPAAFELAAARAYSGVVLLEEYLDGEEFCIDGLVYAGRYRLGGITGRERSDLPHRFNWGLYMPPNQDAASCALIETVTAQALQAVGFTLGTTHAEVVLTPSGPYIVEMAGRPGGARIPTDLVPMTYGMNFIADTLRVALGEAPREERRFERGAAIFYIPAQPGTVTAIDGIAEARAIPGVREVVLYIRPGDAVEPVVDCTMRDRLGHVLTEGPTAAAAVAAAKRARDCCRVMTAPERQLRESIR